MAKLDRYPAAELTVETRLEEPDAPLLAVAGELDISNAGQLETAIAAATANTPERIVFDLSALRYIDSAGVAVLLRAADAVPSVRLRTPSRAVRRVIELTGLTGILPIDP